MQKKLIVTMISSAFAGIAGVAHAGPISVASVKTYATEAIGNVTAIALPPVAYSLTNPLANGSTVTTTFTLSSGSITSCPNLNIVDPSNPQGTFAGTPGGTAAPGQCSYEYTVVGAVGANSTLSFTGGTVSGATALATDGGSVVATVAVGPQGGGVTESNSAAVANSANAWSVSATSSANLSSTGANEQSQVNVAATPPFSGFSDGTNDVTPNSAGTRTIDIGRVRTTANAGNQHLPDGATSFDFDSLTAGNWSLTVTGNFASGATVFVAGTATCAGTVSSFTLNTARTSGTTSFDIAGAAAGDDTSANVYVCYTAGSAGTVIPASQFAVSGAFVPIYAGPTTAATKDLANTNIYNLTLNGSQVDIRNYVPNGFAGWFSAYRIINTGSVPAAVSGQFIQQDGTLFGTAATITSTIPAGGVVVVNSSAVEAVLGSATPLSTGGVGPRLRLTAPTNSLRVQAFACQPSGPCFLNTDAQGVESNLTNFPADGGK